VKIINSSTHAILDYVVVLLLLATPSLLNFSQPISMATYMLASIHLVLTVITDFKGGVFKIIPFRFHGAIELVVSVTLLVVGLSYSFETSAEKFFCIAFALMVYLVWMLTVYDDKTSAKSNEGTKTSPMDNNML
jgi:hypothetical protein